jgi:two-component system, sensor histidine kinase and response regulator
MLINDILDFSKIEAGKLSLERIAFDPRLAIEESLHILRERASSKGVHVACLFPADVPRGVIGDPGRLGQIVMNLLGNAIKFTEQGEVVIQVAVEAQTEQDATLRITVSDSGIGIAEEAQQRLFQSFSQADGSTTRKYGGTGLGLALCKRLRGTDAWPDRRDQSAGRRQQLLVHRLFSQTGRGGLPLRTIRRRTGWSGC